MSFWRHITYGLRALLNREATDRDIAEETQHYLEQATAAMVEAGLAREEAQRVVRLQFGNATVIREQVRSYGWEILFEMLWADVRLAGRRLRHAPGFTVASALTLALSVGASTAIFSALKPILLEPLPYPHSSRLVMVWDVFKGERSDVTFHTYREILARSRSIDGLAVADKILWQPTLTGVAAPERLDGQSVSASYFHVLGLSPALGRDFQALDDRFHGPKVVILSDLLWRRRFDADSAIIGRQIRLDDDLWTVVGVMGAGFDNVLSPSAEIWTPLQFDTGHITQFDSAEWGHHLEMLARVRSESTLDQAKQELDQIAHHRIFEFPRPVWASLSSGFIVDRLEAHVTQAIRPALLAIAGAVLLLLLIACVNVTNLLLARGVRRRGEFAMRTALGASRTRLVTQLVSESLLLSLIGGALAIFVAELGVSAFISLSPAGLPRANAIVLDTGVFAFAFLLTALIGVLTGVIPALEAGRTELVSETQQTSQRIAGSHGVARRALVVGEVALALVLLVSAGLLWRSLESLFAIEPGFVPSHLLTMEIQISGHRYDEGSARHRLIARVLESVRQIPGVLSVAGSNVLPFGGFQPDAYTYGIEFEDGRAYDVCRYVVSPSYFETMRIPLRRGRLLDEHDRASAPQVALISESLARREFGRTDPIGKRAHIGPQNRPQYVVVGVVGNVKQASLAESQLDAVYITPTQSWFADDSVAIIARTRGNPMAFAAAIKNAIWSIDKDQAIVHVAAMDKLLTQSAAGRRFATIIFEAFALAALMLAAVGVYGVLAGSVNERRREIGIRAALGASRRDLLRWAVQQGLQLAGFGIAVGCVIALATTRALTSLLFGISRFDPITYLAVVACVGGICALACWLPAWRAANVSPLIVLRAE